jgi:hypothetical protein
VRLVPLEKLDLLEQLVLEDILDHVEILELRVVVEELDPLGKLDPPDPPDPLEKEEIYIKQLRLIQ